MARKRVNKAIKVEPYWNVNIKLKESELLIGYD